MINIVAFADNDVIMVAWSFGQKLPGCMGFAVYRIDTDGKETPLPSMAVFPNSKRKPGQTTAEFPVQKFYWKDPYARLVASKTGNRKFRYKVVPLEGSVGALTPMSIGYAVSNVIEVKPQVNATLAAYFNRGLISTQHVANALGGPVPSRNKLLLRIADESDSLRSDLAGDMISALIGFITETKDDDELYCALYELKDAQLIAALIKLQQRLHVVLSNPKLTDKQSASSSTDANRVSRQALKDAGAEVIDRMLPNNQIGHNKFAVQVRNGKPVAVLFGSTNWTSTGLCTQTNNTLICREPGLAKRYLENWKALAKDTFAAKGDPKALQADTLRQWDAKSRTFKLAGGGSATSWFSPNTPALRKSNTANEARPPDMDEVAQLILAAKHAVLFLAFYPGSPSIANWAAQAQKANRKLFVRGCVTNPSAAEGFVYELKGTAGRQDPRVIAAMALDKFVPAGWKKEILNAGFAVTHDKIVVVDPFSDHCAVVTGSHNLGHKASFNNDENLVIIRGQRALAEAYATHVLDVYDHFSWRWRVQVYKAKADGLLEVDPDKWQSKYYNNDGTIKNAQLLFWLSALPAEHAKV